MSILTLDQVEEIHFPKHLFWQVVGHARRKLEGCHEPGEEQERKAYGLLGGRLYGSCAEVSVVHPLRRNLRHRSHLAGHLDRLMDEVAVPSETPLDRRGWVADPCEVMSAEREFERCASVLFGGYHMHRVAWEHDPLRDSCTELDTQLTEGSGLWAFILSMVDPYNPRMRAFFEGDNQREAPICLGHLQ